MTNSDSAASAPTFAKAMFDYDEAKSRFDDFLCKHHEEFFFSYYGYFGDYYDNSIEFTQVEPEARLSPELQKFLWNQGFSRSWLNHSDGWETYYYFYEQVPSDDPDEYKFQFKAHEGSRKFKYVPDEDANDSQLAGP